MKTKKNSPFHWLFEETTFFPDSPFQWVLLPMQRPTSGAPPDCEDEVKSHMCEDTRIEGMI